MTTKSPMEFIAETEPIKVEGNVVASYGCMCVGGALVHLYNELCMVCMYVCMVHAFVLGYSAGKQ